MRRAALLIVPACAVLGLGCGSGEDVPTRQTAAKLLKQEAPEGPYSSTSCVELAQERYFRCSATEGTTTSFFDAIVSMDGKAISIQQR